MVEGRGMYRVLVGKPEGKRPMGRPRHRCEGNIKMGLQEVGYGGCLSFHFNSSLVMNHVCSVSFFLL
jgi:hypothetical protein